MLLSEFVHGFICFFEQPKKGGCDFWHWELSYVLHLVKYGHLGGHEHQAGQGHGQLAGQGHGQQPGHLLVQEEGIKEMRRSVVAVGNEVVVVLKMIVALLFALVVLCGVAVLKM